MALKTEEYSYNEDNFIEENGTLKELTVTITLAEYRNLISERCYNEKLIETLHNERVDLNEQISSLSDELCKCKAELDTLTRRISSEAIKRL